MTTRVLLLVALIGLSAPVVVAQSVVGQLHLRVSDPAGAPVQATVTVSSEGTKTSLQATTDDRGRAIFGDLPFGTYHVAVRLIGFAPFDRVVEVRSAVPLEYPVTLGLAGISASVTVRSDAVDTLLDPHGPGSLNYIGVDLLQNHVASAPGRALIDLVSTQPGWILEANGTLHPRASEYQVQYVVDGIPLRDNRSPSFSRAMSPDEYESIVVRTAGYPAEYGGKLGGVIDVTTKRETRPGWHAAAAIEGGSFGAVNVHASAQYVKGQTGAGFAAETIRTDRYLDPPTEANHTNTATGTGFSAHFDRRWRDGDRTRVYAERQQTSFHVPNEEFQEDAGQREERRSEELLGQVTHQHLVSNRVLVELGVMGRHTNGSLTSNEFARPIRPSQQRSLAQLYVNGSVSASLGRHEIKAGVEASATQLEEHWSSSITAYEVDGVPVFDRSLPVEFAFADARRQREGAAFVQDLVRAGPVTASLGLRYDRSRLIHTEDAWSPRLALSWHVALLGVVVRASYDRVFQTPATENLLLASADLVGRLGGEGQRLPLLASRGRFYEVGASRLFLGHLRLDGNYFVRHATNFADDDLLLNTAVAFPIAFASGRVHGFETTLDVPGWGQWSASFSHSYSVGTGQLPIAGGLFLGPETRDLLNSTATFALSQDQRHAVRGRVAYRLGPRATLMAAARVDSGLPVELEGDPDLTQLRSQYGAAVVDHVDFAAGRVKPSAAIDLSASITVWARGGRAIRAHFDVFNVSNRLNVTNFAGLLSGTAVGAPRNWSARLVWQF